jgi:uncharacterized protein (TIGR04255 family)
MVSEDTTGFDPLHKGHAIEQMTIVIRMNKEIDDSSIAAIKAVMGSPPELPRRTDIRGFTVAIGTNIHAPSSTSAGNVGLSFAKFADDGTVHTELRTERSSITYHTTRYTSWENIWSQARKYFASLIPQYLTKVGITGIALVYVDRFIWNGQETPADASKLLRANSVFLCPNVYKVKDLWHSHSGWFDRINPITKRLANVNVDFMEAPPEDRFRRAIVVNTVLTDLFNQPGYDPANPSPEDAIGFVEDHLTQLHDFCKVILSGIISDNMAKRIALTK